VTARDWQHAAQVADDTETGDLLGDLGRGNVEQVGESLGARRLAADLAALDADAPHRD
jgi:hypothetical protein